MLANTDRVQPRSSLRPTGETLCYEPVGHGLEVALGVRPIPGKRVLLADTARPGPAWSIWLAPREYLNGELGLGVRTDGHP